MAATSRGTQRASRLGAATPHATYVYGVLSADDEPPQINGIGGALVDRERMPDFDATVDDIGRAQADRMLLTYAGPLPPHSFVQLRAAGSGR